jgi:hypothetical protein
MSDFFEDKTEGEAKEVEEALEKIKIGDEEYDPKEVQSLIQLGKIGREAEEKFHTKIEKVWPEYTKNQQKLKELELKAQENDQLRQQLIQIQTQSQQPAYNQLPQDQKELIKKQLEDIYGGPILTQTQLDQKEQVKSLLTECSGLETKYNGEDGRPKFVTQDILEHMEKEGFRSPEKAYKDLHEAEIDEWKSKQLQSKKGTGFYTQPSGSTAKSPSPVKVTKDNLSELVAEMVNQEP